MLIERPRSPLKVKHGNKLVHRVGPFQMQALLLLEALGRTEIPPKGIITATGKLREHTVRDMFPMGYIDMKLDPRRPGTVHYAITKIGKDVLRNGITTDGKSAKTMRPKVQALLAKQRARAKAKAAPPAKRNGRRNGAARATG
jgi:hypothetical protein